MEKRYLLAVDDVPLLGLSITVHDIASLEVPFTIPRLRVGLWIGKVLVDDRRSTNAEFASDVKCRDVLTIVIDQPENR